MKLPDNEIIKVEIYDDDGELTYSKTHTIVYVEEEDRVVLKDISEDLFLIGEGNSPEEAKEDFMNSIENRKKDSLEEDQLNLVVEFIEKERVR